MARPIDTPAQAASVLDRLLDVESRLEARLAAAREEGSARVAAAEAESGERLRALEQELHAAREESARRISEATGTRLHALNAARDEKLGRLHRLAREEVAGLAAWVAEEIVSGIGREESGP